MPELAEVERGRCLLESACLGKRIVEVSTTEDLKVFVGDSRLTLESCLPGRLVRAVKRIGKNIYVYGQGPSQSFWKLHPSLTVPAFACHFGMSGSVVIKDGEPMYRRPNYIRKLGTNWPPNKWKICLEFDDGTQIATTDSSRLGRIRAIDAEDASTIPPLSLLGRDALTNMPQHDEMREEILCRTAPIKAVLLDQNGIFAGLGNYLCDEILFQSQIHPAQPSYTLTEAQSRLLHRTITIVVGMCVGFQADTRKYPKTWLYHRRWGRKPGKSFVMADGNTTTITHDRIGGRTTAITQVQILGDYSAIPLPKRRKKTKVAASESEGSEQELTSPKVRRKRKRTSKTTAQYDGSGSDLTALSLSDEDKPKRKQRMSKKIEKETAKTETEEGEHSAPR